MNCDHHPESCSCSDTDLSRRDWLAGAASVVLPGVAAMWLGPDAKAKAAAPVNTADVEKHMKRALELAKKGVDAGDGGPFGAVIVKDGKVIAETWNHVVVNNDPTAHGEILAIREAGKAIKSFNLKGCELYTTGDPCPMCLSAIYWAHIETVYFGFTIAQAGEIAGFDDTFILKELMKKYEERKVVPKQVLGGDATELLKWYSKHPKRVKY